MFILSLWRSKR